MSSSISIVQIIGPVFATAVALRADMATPDFPPTIEHYIAWFLTGLIAGLGTILGPAIADGIKAAVAGKKTE